MIGKFEVIDEQHRRWPAKNGKEGEAYEITLVDVTTPLRHALNHKVRYSLSEEEKPVYWKKLLGKRVEMGITDMFMSPGSPLPSVRGSIIGSELDNKK
jgi:hypothetical protein